MKATIRVSTPTAPVVPVAAPVATVAPAKAANYANREAWLQQAAAQLAPIFQQAGVILPPVHASVGFGYGSRGSKAAVIGQCWDRTASKDGKAHVFVSPTMDNTEQVLATLAHELIHAAIGTSEGHGPMFKRAALAIGLQGKMRSTSAGPTFQAHAVNIIAAIGGYPHAAIDLSDRSATGTPKQGTRMLKFVCPQSGYTVRTTAKWVKLYGPPWSPVTCAAMQAADGDEAE